MYKLFLSLSLSTLLMFNFSPVSAHADESKNQSSAHTSKSLASILDAMPDATKARYGARHPQQTLDFFGIAPGMTVVEALPGGGWYSKILLPYLGAKGHLIGADYALDMYPKFGFFSQERLAKKKVWVKDWTAQANGWRDEKSAQVSAFQFGSMSKKFQQKADAVLFIRALHNLARFENDGEYLTKALKDAHQALKTGGIVGIVQHVAPESADDKTTTGSRGYLKKSFIIAKMKQVGFELVGSSDINLNPKDNPSETDVVWRLPPSLATSRDNETLKKEYEAIGESSRMTLKFKKVN